MKSILLSQMKRNQTWGDLCSFPLHNPIQISFITFELLWSELELNFITCMENLFSMMEFSCERNVGYETISLISTNGGFEAFMGTIITLKIIVIWGKFNSFLIIFSLIINIDILRVYKLKINNSWNRFVNLNSFWL